MNYDWNSENPFIINPYYFANITQVRYEHTWMAFVHHCNNTVAAILGTITCLMVIFLVLKKTPSQFRPYSKVILICSCVDLYFVAVDYVVQFRLRISQGMLAYNAVGPISKANYWWQCRSTCFFSTCILAAYLMLPFQYFYRFSTIKNKRPPTYSQLTVYLMFAVSVVGSVLITSTLAFCTLTNEDEKQEYAMYWYAEVPVPVLTFGIHSNPFVLGHLSYFMSVTIFCYTMTIYLARRTVNVLRRHALQMSQRTFELQKQFGRALFAQALVPLLSAGPVVFAITMSFVRAETGNAGEFVIMSITWFPFFNSLSTLVFISPYRNYCLQPFIKIYKKSVGGSNSISVMPVNE